MEKKLDLVRRSTLGVGEIVLWLLGLRSTIKHTYSTPRVDRKEILSHMGGCQNYGPFLGTLNIR